jgi:hypothetical protein
MERFHELPFRRQVAPGDELATIDPSEQSFEHITGEFSPWNGIELMGSRLLLVHDTSFTLSVELYIDLLII